MTDCVTAEEEKPENVEHTEHKASYKAPSHSLPDSSADCASGKSLRERKYADISEGPSFHKPPPPAPVLSCVQRQAHFEHHYSFPQKLCVLTYERKQAA